MNVSGHIVDLFRREVYPGVVSIANGRVQRIQPVPPDDVDPGFLLPGFVDAHVHIESSMVVPSEFARLAVVHGTVATVSDPHEIGNVLGVEGVRYMIDNGKRAPLKFHFGAPSCVPATPFETSGATIGVEEVEELLGDPDILYLSEMMNYPGVLAGDETVWAKIRLAQRHGKPIDGHAPLVRGDEARRYAAAGISTDHECTSAEEAAEKLSLGMKILVREGSAARNFDALIDLMRHHADRMMFCSDDKHPDELILGHINLLVRRAVERGLDVFDVLRAACVNPVLHYGLDVGLLRPGDAADFIRVDDLNHFEVRETYIDGRPAAKAGEATFRSVPIRTVNRFEAEPVGPSDFEVAGETATIRAIVAVDGAIVTDEAIVEPSVRSGLLVADAGRDLLKIAVVNRYVASRPAVGFVSNFGLRAGAIASSVAHDSHNIIVVGADDAAMARAVNALVASRGGISVVGPDFQEVLPLPVAGLMSDRDAWWVGQRYAELDRLAKRLGSTLRAPFMTLSFMALLVIPALKLGDRGLFDVRTFSFTDLSVRA